MVVLADQSPRVFVQVLQSRELVGRDVDVAGDSLKLWEALQVAVLQNQLVSFQHVQVHLAQIAEREVNQRGENVFHPWNGAVVHSNAVEVAELVEVNEVYGVLLDAQVFAALWEVFEAFDLRIVVF